MQYIYTSFVDQKVINTCFYSTKELALEYAMTRLRLSNMLNGDILSPKLDRCDENRGFWLYKVKEEVEAYDEVTGDLEVWYQTHEIMVARRVVIEY